MTKKNKEKFFLLTDSHVGDLAVGMEDFIIALKNMKEIDSEANLIHLGDLTNYGDSIYMNACLHAIKSYFPESIITLGNHDVRGRKNGLHENADTNGWLDFWKIYWNPKKDKLSDNRLESFSQAKQIIHSYQKKLFGSYEYENCILFVLSTEIPLKDSCYLMEDQLNLLRSTIKEAQNKQKALFVISHQALNNTHTGSNICGGFGPQNDQVEKILSNTKHVIFFSGHVHNGLGNNSVLKREYGYLVDVPSFCYPDNGLMEKGIGYYVTIQGNTIDIETYFFGNVMDNNYKKLDEYRKTIKL